MYFQKNILRTWRSDSKFLTNSNLRKTYHNYFTEEHPKNPSIPYVGVDSLKNIEVDDYPANINHNKVRPHKFIDIGNSEGDDITTNNLSDPQINYVVQYPKVVIPPTGHDEIKNLNDKRENEAYEVIHYPMHTKSRPYEIRENNPQTGLTTTANKNKYKTSYTYTKRKASFQDKPYKRNPITKTGKEKKLHKSDQEKVGIGGISIEHPNFFSNMNSDFGWGPSSWATPSERQSSGWAVVSTSPRPSMSSQQQRPEYSRRNFVVDGGDEDTTRTYSLRKTGK